MSGEFVEDPNWAELSQNPTHIKSPKLDWQVCLGDFIALLYRTWVKSRWWIDTNIRQSRIQIVVTFVDIDMRVIKCYQNQSNSYWSLRKWHLVIIFGQMHGHVYINIHISCCGRVLFYMLILGHIKMMHFVIHDLTHSEDAKAITIPW